MIRKRVSAICFGMITQAILLISCYSDEEKVLPQATRSGENTFGCLVDGVVWLPRRAVIITGSPPDAEAVYNLSTRQLSIGGIQYGQNGSSFHLTTVASSPGRYLLTPYTTNYEGSYYYDGANRLYYGSVDSSSTLTITKFDTINRIVSGKFSLLLFNAQVQKQLKVTDGVFDIALRTYP